VLPPTPKPAGLKEKPVVKTYGKRVHDYIVAPSRENARPDRTNSTRLSSEKIELAPLIAEDGRHDRVRLGGVPWLSLTVAQLVIVLPAAAVTTPSNVIVSTPLAGMAPSAKENVLPETVTDTG